MSAQSEKTKDFYWSDQRDFHFERRKKILVTHPEVRDLIGHDNKLIFKTIFLVILQLVSAYFIGRFNTLIFILSAYFVGATISHALFLAIHEITHNLAFKKQVHNNWLAIFANLPIIFPYAMSFKIYHGMHHKFQGKVGLDTDLPTSFEAKIFRGFLGKMIWEISQIFFYAFRPVFVHPISIKKWQIINIVFQVLIMAIYLPFAGWSGIIYLLLSIIIAGGLNPVSGHFIAEHYVFKEGQETYSYYGLLNKLTFNVGYHNEHHDFPSIPGSKLPQLRKIASEYYDTLYYHTSWAMVILKFIFSPTINLYSRVKRN
jgi:sphingolipid delta-4 desaturase